MITVARGANVLLINVSRDLSHLFNLVRVVTLNLYRYTMIMSQSIVNYNFFLQAMM